MLLDIRNKVLKYLISKLQSPEINAPFNVVAASMMRNDKPSKFQQDFDNIIFLDIDGVLNSEVYYYNQQIRGIKRILRKLVKKKVISRDTYHDNQIDNSKILLLNELCIECRAAIVVSSTWRKSMSPVELQELFNRNGGTFKVIDNTPSDRCGVRGVEIQQWLQHHISKYFDVQYYDFYRFVIIDDDSDMLLNQAPNYFNVDQHVGLTHITCYKIKRFLLHKTF